MNDPASGRTKKVWWLVAGVVVVVLAVGIGMAAAMKNDDSSSTNSSNPQLASVRQACREWAQTRGNASRADWCDEMGTWMAQRVNGAAMGPGMMWGSSARMLATCRQWMRNTPRASSGAGAATWCNSMVGWMDDHMDDSGGHWGRGMMGG